MADHTITLTATEESIYAKYLLATATTEVQVMARLKSSLTEQVLQTINEKGTEKFKGLSVANKIIFLES